MKNLIYTLFLFASLACANTPINENSSGVPVSVSDVHIGVVGERIVRAIQHNMELNPVIQFEIMARPDFNVIHTVSITQVTIGNEKLSFKNSGGAFVEDIQIKDDHVSIKIDYFYLNGGSTLLSCSLPVKGDYFAEIKCSKK